jgi:hypothetical protein
MGRRGEKNSKKTLKRKNSSSKKRKRPKRERRGIKPKTLPFLGNLLIHSFGKINTGTLTSSSTL